jgi:tetratricopeptide (TPR) repeat protein
MSQPTAARNGRFRTAVGRRTALLVIAAAVLAGLVAGLVVVGVQRQEAEHRRLQAESNFEKAHDTIERLLTRIGQERLKGLPQMESLRSELLEDALQFQLGLLTEHSDDPAVLYRVARAARMAAGLQVQLNRLDEAERTCRQALSILDDLTARAPLELSYRRERATVLDTMGLALATLERTSEAEAAYRLAMDVRGLIVMEQPGSGEDRWRMAVCLDHLGVLCRDAGRWDEAEHFFVRGRQLCLANPPSSPADPRVHQELVRILSHLSRLQMERGRRAEALQGYAHAVREQKALAQASPRTSAYRELLVTLLLSQAAAMAANRQPAQAEHTLVEARELAQRLRADFPAVPHYHELAASVLTNLANLIRSNPARAAEARAILDAAIALQEQLVAMAAAVPEYRFKLAAMCDSLANLLRAQHQLPEAEALYRKELANQSRLAAEYPQVLAYRFGHGQVLHNLADLLRERGRLAEALPRERDAVRLLGSVYQSNIRNPDYRTAMSYACWTLCAILVDRKDHRAAAAAIADYLRIEPNGYEESYEAAEFLCRCAQLAREDATVPADQREPLARSYADRAMDALRTAVRNGFRDAKHLESDPTYAPIRARADFGRLVREVQAMTETTGTTP